MLRLPLNQFRISLSTGCDSSNGPNASQARLRQGPMVVKKITNQGIFCTAAQFGQASKLHHIAKCDRSKRNERVSPGQKLEIETKNENINMQLKLIRKNLGRNVRQ